MVDPERGRLPLHISEVFNMLGIADQNDLYSLDHKSGLCYRHQQICIGLDIVQQLRLQVQLNLPKPVVKLGVVPLNSHGALSCNLLIHLAWQLLFQLRVGFDDLL